MLMHSYLCINEPMPDFRTNKRRDGGSDFHLTAVEEGEFVPVCGTKMRENKYDRTVHVIT